MSKNTYKFRKYTKSVSTKPLIVGWVPSKKKLDLMAEGRAKELPGYWWYNAQTKFPGLIGIFCAYIFSKFYASKPVK